MNAAQLAWRAVRYHRGLAIGAAVGIAVSTAVITGALLLGDSLQATLRQRLAARLGPVAQAMIAPRPLAPAMAEHAVGVRHLDGAVTADDGATIPTRVLGVDERCRGLFTDLPPLPPRGAAVTPALARDLGLRVGDGLVVAVAIGHRLPAGSAFTENRHERLQKRMRVTVAAILPEGGVGAFSLDPGLDAPRSVWLDRAWLAGVLGEDRIDAVISGGDLILGEPTLADLGLRLVTDPALGQVTVQGDGLVLAPGLEEAARQAATACGGSAAANAVHLADRIVREGGGEVSYALVAAREGEGSGDGSIDLSAWLAADLGVAVGDRLKLQFPLAGGRFHDATLTVHAIIPDEALTRDAAIVPMVPGLTDAERIDRWDLPYPIVAGRITARDDAWWAAHRTAPKAFVDPALLHRLWGMGPLGVDGPWAAGVRVRPPAGEDLAAFARRFDVALRAAVTPADAGLVVQHLQRQAESRSQGNADLGGLFLGLGSVAILASLALTAALIRLQIGQRAAEVGVLLACGWSAGAVRRLLLTEVLTIAALGAVAGTALGVAWAGLLIAMLAAGWGGAAVGVPLSLHVGAGPLLIGGGAGLLTGILAAAWGLRALLRQAPLTLLAGGRVPSGGHSRRWRVPLVCAEALRFPGRSLLVVGLMASAALMLVLVAAQRRGIGESGRDGPTGGYALRLTTALPLPEDLASPAGRARLGCTPEEERVLAGMGVAAFLVGPGEDISCRNPARPAQPRILGCLNPMQGFGVPPTAWLALADGGDAIPVLGDADSLRWTLGIDAAAGATLPIRGIERRLRIAGAFPGSVFAGELVMGEASFRRCFPAVTAPSCFLLELPAERVAAAATILRRRLAGLGVEVRPAAEVVAAQLAVRDAYLSLFLALGGLGLLIGAGGLAVVLARSALERRSELALLAALGRRPGLVLFAGHALLLGIGLILGLAAAALAVWLGPPTQGAWLAAWPAVLAVVLAGLAAAAVAARSSAGAGLVQELRRE